MREGDPVSCFLQDEGLPGEERREGGKSRAFQVGIVYAKLRWRKNMGFQTCLNKCQYKWNRG